MNSTVSIRDYGIGDLEEMFQLDQLCFTSEFRFDLRSMRSFAERKNAIVRLAQAGETISGFVIVHRERTVAYIVTLDVAEARRRMGIAALLIEDVETRAREAGAVVMGLHVFSGNVGAIRFYERMGYERMGLEEGFYGSSGLDAFVYRKLL